MADLAIAAASVAETATTQISTEICAENVPAGAFVYRDSATSSQLRKADCTTVAKSAVVGMAMSTGDVGQRIRIATDGDVTVNAVGVTPWGVILSPTAGGGKCIVFSDVAFVATDILTYLGVFTTTTNLKLGIRQSGQAK